MYLGRWGEFLKKLTLRKALEAMREVATVMSSRRISGNCNSKSKGVELEVCLSLLLSEEQQESQSGWSKTKQHNTLTVYYFL